jgi:hypothetical protein
LLRNSVFGKGKRESHNRGQDLELLGEETMGKAMDHPKKAAAQPVAKTIG